MNKRIKELADLAAKYSFTMPALKYLAKCVLSVVIVALLIIVPAIKNHAKLEQACAEKGGVLMEAYGRSIKCVEVKVLDLE